MEEWRDRTEESRKRWEQIGAHWDAFMGPGGNDFHKALIRPGTEELLAIQPGQRILEIACGNGNFARRLAALGAQVVALDFSSELIKAAEAHSKGWDIEYHIMDATDERALLTLGVGCFDAVVANMAIMDMAEIRPMIRSAYSLLTSRGRVVLSLQHPCFQPPGSIQVTETEEVNGAIITRHMLKISRYKDPEVYEGLALFDQPVPHLYFHRSLASILEVFFEEGFVLNGMKEPVLVGDREEKDHWSFLPPAMILRFRKG